LKWFLKGDTNIRYLVQNGCNIWNGDAYKRFTYYTDEQTSMKRFIELIKTDDEFSKKWGELGPIYGKQWRSWELFIPYDVTTENCKVMTKVVDQIKNLIETLKTNPDSRRMMVNAWNVGDISDMVLPPCHYGFQVYTRELSPEERYEYWFRNNYEQGMEWNLENPPNFDDEYYEPTPTRAISLLWNQRSVDTFLGLPFNIASYGMLLELIAHEVGMMPDQLIGNLGDTHLYSNHLEQAKEQIKRKPFSLPIMKILNSDIYNGEFNYEIAYYHYHPAIKAPLSN